VITGVGSIPVPVTDLDRALRFYRDTLGFAVREDRRMPDGTRRVALAPGHAEPDVTLTLTQETGDHSPIAGVAFLTNDIHRTYAALHERGVVFVDEPCMQDWGDWEVEFQDPDGNRFRLVQRARRSH